MDKAYIIYEGKFMEFASVEDAKAWLDEMYRILTKNVVVDKKQ